MEGITRHSLQEEEGYYLLLHTVERLEGKGVQGIHYKRRSLLCSGTYTGQVLWVTVLDEW